MLLKGYVSNLDENLDSKGRIYYTDENGNVVKPDISPLQGLKNKLDAFGFNASRWLNETNPDSLAYKQKTNTALALTTMPFGLGRAATSWGASKLTPFLGKKIGEMTAQGIGSGIVGGGLEEGGRALIEGQNPFTNALKGASIGGLFGLAGSLGLGKLGQKLDLRNLYKNPAEDAFRQYADNYLEGLNTPGKLGQEFRAARQGVGLGDIQGDTLYSFIGENAFNAPKGKLMEAKQMAMYGDSNADIRNATGWFKGVDGKWRYEIPDGNLIENPNLLEQFDDDIGTYYTGKIKDIYDAPELYKNYPQIANRDVVIQSMPDLMEGNSWGDSIALNKRFLTKSNPEFTAEMNRLTQTPEYKAYDNAYNIRTGDSVKDFANIEKAQKEFFETDIGKKYHNLMWEKNPSIPREVEGWNEDTLDTLVHELQHQIQDIEGFAKGGSSKNPNYHNLAGEVEARLAGTRAKLTPEQRQIYNPANESSYLSNYGYDVIPEKQIVEFKNDKNSLYNKLANNNGVVDLTNSFSKNPTIAEVKAHIQNLINNGIKYDTLSPDWKIDIIGGKAKADHIVKSSQYGKMNKSKVNRHNKYIASIEDLINNSTYSSSKSNTKIAKKPNVDTYHYFETNVKIGNKQYKVILNAEQFKGESTIKPQTVHLYDVLEIK